MLHFVVIRAKRNAAGEVVEAGLSISCHNRERVASK
jgi:hypothetical protein